MTDPLAWWVSCADPVLLRHEVARLAGLADRHAAVVAQHRDAADAARERARVLRRQRDEAVALVARLRAENERLRAAASDA